MKLLFAAAFALFALSTFDQVDSSAYDKIVTHSRIRAKKQGPNVCALQQVSGTKKKYFSTCRNWHQRTICGKEAQVVYECCPGYTKLGDLPGCPAAVPIDHVYGTLGLVNAITTQEYSSLSKLKEEIEGVGSYTFFAPSNEAWDLLDVEVRGALVSNVNIELYNALHYHMADKRFLTKDLKNGLILKSMYNDLTLHINHYPNGVVTVNCARIIHGNQVATNGVVHVIDRVITTVSNTIRDVLDIEDELSTLNTVASKAGLLEKMGKPGHFTLFAPTNEAFHHLEKEVKDRLMNSKSSLQAVFNYHLLDSVQCSEAIMSGTSHETVEGSNIEIGCDGDSITVNGVKMVHKKDIVTSNGVIHLIDRVLMPNSAKQVLELIGHSESTFGDMVSELGLSAAMRPKAEYTLLAPHNIAFNEEIMSMDHSDLRIILENHILKKKILLSQLFNGQRLETLGGKFLRVFVYRTAVCIENACLIRGSKEGQNGALHLMKTLIKPSESSMFKLLTDHGGFKIFLSLMEEAGLTDLLKQEGHFTLFAPSDEAFAGLSDHDIHILKSDPNALKAILLYHFTKDIFIGAGLESRVTNLLKSLQGSHLKFLFGKDGLHVNSVLIPKSDLMATNGVIHITNSLLYPEDVPVGNQELFTLLGRFVKHIHIKYSSGHRFHEIPLTFIKRVITVPGVTHDTHREPSIAKVTRLIQEPATTKLTRVIKGPHTEFIDLDADAKKIIHGIQDGRRVSGRHVPAGVRRRTRMTKTQ
ncbi:periostin, osteoblast specific factor b isoform X2 [Neoarius graeffei]|uniref:periostin, osteoblast specific factor b isoform X2 n=1 Tax=Neoarius graeffei TaxID=443677 RepID=UPI00298C3147|nr:periostin, osteoblast specific factor b isoform X2 [Neoarius graeffei]